MQRFPRLPSDYFQRFASNTNIFEVSRKLADCYTLLGIADSKCDRQQLKSRYVELAKRFHPDTGENGGDSAKFQRVRDAYRYIVEQDFSQADREDLLESPQVRQFDIRHKAPQHRQYLEYGGVGSGTPSERLRQYQQHRVREASDTVGEHMTMKIVRLQDDATGGALMSTEKEKEYARKWRTR